LIGLGDTVKDLEIPYSRNKLLSNDYEKAYIFDDETLYEISQDKVVKHKNLINFKQQECQSYGWCTVTFDIKNNIFYVLNKRW